MGRAVVESPTELTKEDKIGFMTFLFLAFKADELNKPEIQFRVDENVNQITVFVFGLDDQSSRQKLSNDLAPSEVIFVEGE